VLESAALIRGSSPDRVSSLLVQPLDTASVVCRLPARRDQLGAGFAMSILSLRTPRRRENWAGLLVDADPFLGV
jgi:hypothetical protein